MLDDGEVPAVTSTTPDPDTGLFGPHSVRSGSMSGRRAPSGLSRWGRELWKSVVDDYELRVDELELLEHACRQPDLVDRMQGELETAQLTVKGAYNQVTAHPLVSEIRQPRTVLAGLLGKLKIPDLPGAAVPRSARVSEAARKAARARRGLGGPAG